MTKKIDGVVEKYITEADQWEIQEMSRRLNHPKAWTRRNMSLGFLVNYYDMRRKERREGWLVVQKIDPKTHSGAGLDDRYGKYHAYFQNYDNGYLFSKDFDTEDEGKEALIDFFLAYMKKEPKRMLDVNEMAKGWDKGSVEKFGKTIGKSPHEHGFFAACVTEMKKKGVEDPEGMCAQFVDVAKGTTMWRGKGKQ